MTILDLSDQAVIVVENVVPTLQTVRGFFDLLGEVNFPTSRQRVLMNRFSTRSGSPGVGDVSQYLGRKPDYVVPFDRGVILAANTGIPVVMSGRRCKAKTAFRNLAKNLENQETDSQSVLSEVSEVNAGTQFDQQGVSFRGESS